MISGFKREYGTADIDRNFSNIKPDSKGRNDNV